MQKQLSNAQEKLERAQKHAEDKRVGSQQTLERLQREYDEMAEERKDNDRQVEELRAAADDIERKMAEHMRQSQAELNELLTEYWKLRYATGEFASASVYGHAWLTTAIRQMFTWKHWRTSWACR